MKDKFEVLFTGNKTEGKTSAYCTGADEEGFADEANGDRPQEYDGASPSAAGGGEETDTWPSSASEDIKNKAVRNSKPVTEGAWSSSQTPRKSRLAQLVRKTSDLVNFCDLPIRKKFLLYALGAVFWVLVISAIGLITMFEMSSNSQQMVERIWPQEKTANIVIRKLRGANISVHNIATYTDREVVRGDFRRAKGTLADSHLYLNTLLQGGQIADHMLATDQFAEPYRVLPVRAQEKRETIEKAKARVSELDRLVDEVLAGVQGEAGKAAAFRDPLARKALVEKILRYDNLTRETVTMLNDYAISVSQEWGRFAAFMKYRFTLAILLISVTLCSTLALAVVFGLVMSNSFEKHLNDIIEQIRALSSGELDLTKKIDQTSKDELGVLSGELNRLMDTIANVTTFKKVIEGDDSTEDIYLRLGKIFNDELGINDCVIYEISDSKKTMEIVYPPGSEGLEMHCRMDVQMDCELCRAKRTGLMVSSRDFPAVCKYYIGGESFGHLCIPIITGGTVGGIVQLVCAGVGQCDKVILERKTARAQQYVREAQPVLEVKRLMKTLKDSSLRDGMTGLYNRRFLEECCEKLIAGIQRRKTSLGLLMCDLDFFKETNDIHGHDVGDMVLKETSRVISKSVRASDLVVRFGGEEFLVLLTDTESAAIVASAEKIRAAIEETQVKVAGGVVRKTISIGASEFPTDTQNFWEAIKYADVALYKAKESGRNRVMRFSREMWTQERY